jgi:lipid-binding SYLF domain-containing protein
LSIRSAPVGAKQRRGARGIFIAPSSTSIGFILGSQQGVGVLLARHGQVWSDPVFIRLSNYDVGFLAGASKSEVMMLVRWSSPTAPSTSSSTAFQS